MTLQTIGVQGSTNEASVAEEFQRLARYLTGVEASDYQISKYIRLHRLNALAPDGGFERFLDTAAAFGPLGLRLADAYSGTFCRAAPLQRKLMATVAILECSPPGFEIFDTPRGEARWAYLRLATASVSGLLTLGVAAILFAPVHIGARLAGRVSQ
jgi:hypothetical protein